ncbi:hypothetical protein F5Y19DRAFT_482282 [Xylariaceae sp. FL1651]|nr:hypothetical protein F5Y19DRAFT_482282 [Xylariaceae sp. FL1651]
MYLKTLLVFFVAAVLVAGAPVPAAKEANALNATLICAPDWSILNSYACPMAKSVVASFFAIKDQITPLNHGYMVARDSVNEHNTSIDDGLLIVIAVLGVILDVTLVVCLCWLLWIAFQHPVYRNTSSQGNLEGRSARRRNAGQQRDIERGASRVVHAPSPHARSPPHWPLTDHTETHHTMPYNMMPHASENYHTMPYSSETYILETLTIETNVPEVDAPDVVSLEANTPKNCTARTNTTEVHAQEGIKAKDWASQGAQPKPATIT